MTGINNEAFINMIIDISNGMPPKKMMRERFGLESRDILSYQEEFFLRAGRIKRSELASLCFLCVLRDGCTLPGCFL